MTPTPIQPAAVQPGLHRGAAPAALRALAAALLLAAGTARGEVQPLAVDLRWDLPVTAGAAVGALVLSTSLARPGHCRWCGEDRFDAWTRRELRWSRPSTASTASDVLVNGVLPVAVLANSFVFARRGGDPDAFWEDTLVIAEAAAITGLLNAAAKDAFARRRPNAGPDATGSSNAAFFSGHTSLAFTLATAAGTVSTIRGYPSAPWVWAGGMTLAAGIGYLRIAGDQHWGTDVLTGAAVGGAVGFAIPWLFHRVRRPGARVAVIPAPGGFGVVF
jgi:membrane-associated phospholipid phosphatase